MSRTQWSSFSIFQWPRMIAASWIALAWAKPSEVIA
jgi:hypothetical protein